MYFAFTSPNMPPEVRAELYRNLWFLADVHPDVAEFARQITDLIEDEEEES